MAVNENELKYSDKDEWVRIENGIGVIGITDYAQDQLGDIVYVDFKVKPGDEVTQDGKFGEIESVKAVSDLFSPISGRVIEVNQSLKDNPDVINRSPYEEGWMLRIEPKDTSELNNLMDKAQYDATRES